MESINQTDHHQNSETSPNYTPSPKYAPSELFPTGPLRNWLFALYSSTAIIALCLNVVTFVVLHRNKHLFPQIRLHLITLCIVAILMATFSIPSIYVHLNLFLLDRWVLPYYLCPIVPAGQMLLLSVWSCTLLALTAELYCATFHSCLCILQWIQSHRAHTICSIWLLGALAAGPLVLVSNIQKVPYNNKKLSSNCTANTTGVHGTMLFWLLFVPPIVAHICMFTRMRFFRRSNQIENENVKALNANSSMLVTLVALFALIWLPFEILIFQLTKYHPNFLVSKPRIHSTSYYIYDIYYYLACHWLSMGRTMLNPIVYYLMNNEFKMSTKRMLKSWLCLKVVDGEEQHDSFVTNQLNMITEQ